MINPREGLSPNIALNTFIVAKKDIWKRSIMFVKGDNRGRIKKSKIMKTPLPPLYLEVMKL